MPLRFGWSITTEYGTSNHCPGSVGLCGCFNKTLYPSFAISHSTSAGWPSPVSQHGSPALFVRLWNHALSCGRIRSCGWAVLIAEKSNRTQSHHASHDQPAKRVAALHWGNGLTEPPVPPFPWVIGTARRFNRHFRIDVVDGARSRHRSAIGWFVEDESHEGSRPHANHHDRFGYRQERVQEFHGIDAAEKVIVRKQLRRGQITAFFEALARRLVGMEACATSHHWARELTKLGHEVRLMPAKDVKAYVKRNKNDAADAEAICEAVRRPTMRFVRIKSAEQQGQLILHPARDLLMRQRTQVINALRAHLAEFGVDVGGGENVIVGEEGNLT